MQKPRIVGVVGATGTGKTTLCERSEMPFIRTDVSGVYKKFGRDPKFRMSLLERLEVQTAILDHHIAMWRDQSLKYAGQIIVTDRTPICFMTYTLAEISGYSQLGAEEDTLLLLYLARCRAALFEHFAGIFHLTGSPHAVATDDGKVRAITSRPYHEHYQAISVGLTVDNVATSRYHIDHGRLLDDRLTSLKNFVGNF